MKQWPVLDTYLQAILPLLPREIYIPIVAHVQKRTIFFSVYFKNCHKTASATIEEQLVS